MDFAACALQIAMIGFEIVVVGRISDAQFPVILFNFDFVVL